MTDFEKANLIYSQSPSEKYNNIAQSWVNNNFYNSTLVKDIQQESESFDKVYTTYEAQVDTVSDFNTNLNKIDGNYLSIQFKDCSKESIRGQKFIFNDDTYLCYKETEELSTISKTYVIKCTNNLNWLEYESGKIIEEPCFLGWEMTSTNARITKDGTTENRRLILLIQGNENTSEITVNQRFLISKNKAFKVTQVFSENLNHLDEDYATLIKVYLEWDSVLTEKDNTELLVADYYNYNYELTISSDDLSLTNGSIGQLNSSVLLNGESIITDVEWSTSNSDAVTIDSLGNYEVIGLSGLECQLECHILGNENVSNYINIEIVDSPILTKELLLSPSTIDYINKGSSKTIEYGVYENGVLTADVVTIIPSGANDTKYDITYNENSIDISCLNYTSDRLILTFTSGTMEEIVTIRLVGIM